MSTSSHFDDAPFRDPYRDFPDQAEHNGFKMYGRFIPRLESSPQAKYQLWVQREEPLVSFDVEVITPVIDVVDLTEAELHEMMKEQAFAEAKEIVDSGTYEHDEVRSIEFNRP